MGTILDKLIEIFFTGNPSLLEVAWSVIAAVGLIVSLVNQRVARLDRRARRQTGDNGLLLLAAEANLASEGDRVIVMLLFLVAGIGAMFTPAPVHVENRIYSVAISLVFIMAELRLAFGSVRDRRTRLRQQRLYLQVLRQRAAEEHLATWGGNERRGAE